MSKDGANKFGRASELRLVAERRGEKTVLADVAATMPFRVMHPFEVPTAKIAGAAAGEGLAPVALQVMVMSASAGIMAGDAQCVDVCVGAGAALQVTTQAFDKVHRMGEEESASRETRLRVANGGFLDYSPQPMIPFAGSAYAASASVELAGPDASLVYEEVLSCGRAARGERFGYRSFRNRVRVDVAGAPVYVDNTVYEPDRMPMEEFGLYEGFSHLGNMVLVNCRVGEAAFLAARDYLREETGVIGAAAGSPVGASAGSEAVAGGVTRLASGDVCVRLLGHRAQRVGDVLSRTRALLI
ncbi:urease accessory protein UreD [Paratractidigestivibacter sp.]|uniref:urease accessory protein UreD n=1 Tax=Paratractidigestivibacter sp. TaxID=2847316 RepID=UPI002AC98126|nr:urease accessory protein UreD [Paratractidigestivibacter sp.]